MDKAQLLAELIELTALPAAVGADEIAVSEYVRAMGCSVHTGQKRLDALVAQGTLTRRAASIAGRPCWAYRKVT